MTDYIAHSANAVGLVHSLEDHLCQTARLAAEFAATWGCEGRARLAGTVHDVGKISEQFQRYVRGQADSGGDHSGLGAYVAADLCSLVSFTVAGHHAGLPDKSDLKARLKQIGAGEGLPAQRSQQLLSRIGLPDISPLPAEVDSDPIEADLFTRMLFSALVDADRLNTERHVHSGPAAGRGDWASLRDLWTHFQDEHAGLVRGSPPTPVNALRNAVFSQCLAAAEEPQGMLSLTVPTGGGKTLSAMAFALRHAVEWDLRRVIVVIPYTSIIDQTADEYRRVLGERAVLEHHTAIDWQEVDDNDRQRWQLAAENWDAPVVVTTSVQFFESLFSNRPAACRKLHNIAGSVVIIDEVQTTPTGILRPTFEILRGLTRRYQVTILLSTATHPAYQRISDEAGAFECREIVQDPAALFRELRRVEFNLEYETPPRMPWTEVAAGMAESTQALTVVNTRADARAVFESLPHESRYHLSTTMCGAHRRAKLAEIRQLLLAGEPCRLVSTQLIEAGVDLDFPLVLRAMGPLDRIVQAAGRCNREGRAKAGRVVVFEATDGAMPPGSYRAGAETARSMLNQSPLPDLHDPDTYTEYFRRLYHAVDLDKDQISRDRSRLLFATVARNYRVIDDATVPVAVPWADGEALLTDIEAGWGDLTRDDLRALQPYFVSLQPWEHKEAVVARLCREIAPGLWRWEGRYDDDVGLLIEAGSLPALIVSEGGK